MRSTPSAVGVGTFKPPERVVSTHRATSAPGPLGTDFPAVPVLDEPPGDRDARRQEDVPRRDGLGELRPGQPPGVRDLLPVDADRDGAGAGDEAEHEAGRERPGLAAEVLDLPDVEAGL